MTIQIGNKVIEFDGVIDFPEENAVQLYRIKSKFDDGVTYRFNKNLLSNFGKQILCGDKVESEDKNGRLHYEPRITKTTL